MRIGFSVALMTLSVLAVMVMVNYLSTQFSALLPQFADAHPSFPRARTSLLHLLTNRVQVTVYCSKTKRFQRPANPAQGIHLGRSHLSVRYMITIANRARAEEFKLKYRSRATSTNKNLIVFECEGRTKTVLGDALVAKPVGAEQSDTPGQLALRQKADQLLGELLFTGALMRRHQS